MMREKNRSIPGNEVAACSSPEERRPTGRACGVQRTLTTRATAGLRGVVMIVVFALAGCGYTLVGSGTSLPPDVKKVYIPVSENFSTEGAIGAALTEAIQDQFERYGAVSVVDSIADADAILRTRVLSVVKSARSTTGTTDTALQQTATMVLNVELRRVNGSMLWQDPQLRVSTTFGTTRESVVTSSAQFSTGTLGASDLANLSEREIARGQESEALVALSYEAAEQIYDSAIMPEF